MNLAYFSERPRAFILALASAALNSKGESVMLFDKQLAQLQNCSKRTVMRQRADYLKERAARKFDPLEIIEGEYDRTRNANAATHYRFRLGGEVSEIVTLARTSKEWREGDREAQRAAIKRAAGYVYGSIPDAPPPKKRKEKRNRLATSEIETFKKIVATNLHKLQERTGKLPPMERERLVENPGDLRQWWLEVRAQMDAFLDVDSAQTSVNTEVKQGGGQFVTTPPKTAKAAEPVTVLRQEEAVTHSPEAIAAFDRTFAGLTEPKVRSRVIPLDGEAVTLITRAVDEEVAEDLSPIGNIPEDESPPAEVSETFPPMAEISDADSDEYDGRAMQQARSS
jgi:hypothetical protein